MVINKQEIEERIRLIKVVNSDDPETQHQIEDHLRSAFIRSIAEGEVEGDIKELAKLVLTTEDIEFPRWYA